MPEGASSRAALRVPMRAVRPKAWVLIVSTALEHLSAMDIVRHYAWRMQIEESFRDLKDPRYGAALRHSMTRVAARMEILIMLHALASIAAWLRAQIARHDGDDARLLAHPQEEANRTVPTLSLWRVSYRAKRGQTLTVVLNFRTGRLRGFLSNRREWEVLQGTFEVVGGHRD